MDRTDKRTRGGKEFNTYENNRNYGLMCVLVSTFPFTLEVCALFFEDDSWKEVRLTS